MKRKTLTLAISVFALLAIISVGFASWVISRPNQANPVQGSIVVEDVQDKSLGITYEWVTDSTGAIKLNTDPVIVFGKPATVDTETAKWLNNTDIAEENLNAYLKISVSNAANLDNQNIKVNFEAVVPDGNTTFATSKDTSFVLPASLYNLTKDDFDGKSSYVVTLKFNWGSDFNNHNPIGASSKWAGGYTEAKAAEASTALHALYTALNGVTYKVTITAVDK